MAETSTSIASRLRSFNAAKANMQKSLEEPQPDQTPLGLSIQANDPEQEVIDNYNKTIPMLKINSKYSELPQVTEGLQAVTSDFPDDKLLNIPAVTLTKWDIQELVEMGRKTIPMFSSGFSQQGVGNLFVLAYHILDPADDDIIFSDEDTPLNANDREPSELNSNVAQTRIATEMDGTNIEPDQEVKAYSYIAASALRLFTKSEDNYVKAFNHIIAGYQRFYGHNMPINAPIPTIEAIRTLSHFFSHSQLFKSTLYRILYIGGGCKKAEGMRRFLYEIHLANTGMHIVSIFVRLCNVLNCEPGVLLTAINSKEYMRQLDSMVTMIKLISKDDDAHKRRMWRYGRIFDETFMAPLQTKACPQLVYILASALKSESSKTNQNILDIAQLADVGANRKKKLSAIGEMVVKMIRQYNASEESSPAMSLLYS